MAARALLVGGARAQRVGGPLQLARRASRGRVPKLGLRQPPRPAPLAASTSGRRGARQRAHEPRDRARLGGAVGVAQRDRLAGPSAQRRAEGEQRASRPARGRPPAAGRGVEPAGGHGIGGRAPPAPKKRAASVACPATGPAQRRREDRAAAGGRGRPASGRPKASAARVPGRPPRPRAYRPVPGSHGFTPQYSNQVARRARARAVADGHVVEQHAGRRRTARRRAPRPRAPAVASVAAARSPAAEHRARCRAPRGRSA